MRLNRDVVITSIIKHQFCFMTLLDDVDQRDGALEFSESLYLSLYRNEICLDDDNNVHSILSLESLVENGVFISHDKTTGMIAFEPTIVGLLRFMDVKRAKTLSKVDFENLRFDMNKRVSDLKLVDEAHPDFSDYLSAINALLIDVHGTIRRNCDALEAQVSKISTLYIDYMNDDKAVDVITLYNTVNDLFDRYVKPCNEFIDPMLRMKRTRTFLEAVNDAADYIEHDLHLIKQANAIRYRLSGVSSFFKDISILVEKLRQYASQLDKDRKDFLAIDEAFNSVMAALHPLRHGKQRNKFLTPDMSIFQQYTCFDGVNRHKAKFAPLLTFKEQLTPHRFEEYLLIIDRLAIANKKHQSLVPLPAMMDVDEQRQIEIVRLLLEAQPFPSDIDDLYVYIDDLLGRKLSDYFLGDALVGVQELSGILDQAMLSSKRVLKTMTDDKYILRYKPLVYREKPYV